MPEHTTRLLRWYDQKRRDLPWRRSPEPYITWVAEIMLQQTRAETVKNYFEPFLERFPTLGALAAAREEQVRAAWSGLGYYRRARNLHRAAQQLVREGRGVPASAEELQELPGVGPYTASAIASIAFGVRTPVLDGNVERVLTRLLAEVGNPKTAKVRKRLLLEAEGWLDPARPGDSNQALMELGAMVCRVREPHCQTCPLEPDCRAARQGNPEAYPRRATKHRVVHLQRSVAVVERYRRLLLFRRPASEAVLAETWEFPFVSSTARGELAVEFERAYGGRWKLVRRLGQAHHAVTYRRLAMDVYLAQRSSADEIAEGGGSWFARSELVALPRSSMVTKVLKLLDQGDNPG